MVWSFSLNWIERYFSFWRLTIAFLVIISYFLAKARKNTLILLHCKSHAVLRVDRSPEMLTGLPEIERMIWLVRMPTRCHFSLVFDGNFSKWMLTGGNLDFLDSSPTMWVFKCFLSCIYLLLYLKSVIVILFQQIRSYFSTSLRTCTHGKIRDDSRTLTKLPRHISFVVLESDISFVDVAQLIVWSMAMGIPYISVYDREGKMFAFT